MHLPILLRKHGLTVLAGLALASLMAAPSHGQTATSEATDAVPRISVEELQKVMKTGDVLVLDVRSQTSFEAAHIAGAVHIPEGRLATGAQDLPRDRPIVTYCA